MCFIEIFLWNRPLLIIHFENSSIWISSSVSPFIFRYSFTSIHDVLSNSKSNTSSNWWYSCTVRCQWMRRSIDDKVYIQYIIRKSIWICRLEMAAICLGLNVLKLQVRWLLLHILDEDWLRDSVGPRGQPVHMPRRRHHIWWWVAE